MRRPRLGFRQLIDATIDRSGTASTIPNEEERASALFAVVVVVCVASSCLPLASHIHVRQRTGWRASHGWHFERRRRLKLIVT